MNATNALPGLEPRAAAYAWGAGTAATLPYGLGP